MSIGERHLQDVGCVLVVKLLVVELLVGKIRILRESGGESAKSG